MSKLTNGELKPIQRYLNARNSYERARADFQKAVTRATKLLDTANKSPWVLVRTGLVLKSKTLVDWPNRSEIERPARAIEKYWKQMHQFWKAIPADRQAGLKPPPEIWGN